MGDNRGRIAARTNLASNLKICAAGELFHAQSIRVFIIVIVPYQNSYEVRRIALQFNGVLRTDSETQPVSLQQNNQ